jgi:hypothetical protein
MKDRQRRGGGETDVAKCGVLWLDALELTTQSVTDGGGVIVKVLKELASVNNVYCGEAQGRGKGGGGQRWCRRPQLQHHGIIVACKHVARGACGSTGCRGTARECCLCQWK